MTSISSTLLLVLVILLIGFIGYLVILLFKHKQEKSEAEVEKASLYSTLDAIEKDRTELQSKIATLEEQISVAHNEKLQLVSDLNVQKNTNLNYENELTELRRLNQELDSQNRELIAKNSNLSAKINTSEQLFDEQQKRFDTSYKELQEQLKVMGHELVKNASEDLNKNSNQTLSTVVNPLKEEITNFKKLLNDSQETTAKRHGELQKEIELLEKSHSNLSKQAEDLTKALRQGGKSQGMWGELQLERVLDSAGLVKGIEYQREVAGFNASGDRGRPDAVVFLPEKKCIIIDAKCSITAYIDYINATDDDQRNTALKDHCQSIRKHLDELIKKDYSSYEQMNSPSFVFMFVPVDDALSVALRDDPTMYDKAAKSKIYLVSPSSLMPSLRVVSNLWILSEQTEHMKDLAKLAQRIISKFSNIESSLDDAIKAGNKFQSAIQEVDARLRNGKDNLKTMLSRFDANSTRKFKELEGVTIDASSKEELTVVD